MSDREKILEAALRELADAVDIKASALANPARYYSPRMELAMEAARALTNSKSPVGDP